MMNLPPSSTDKSARTILLSIISLANRQADAAVYNTLINACAGVGDLEKALETVQAMQVRY